MRISPAQVELNRLHDCSFILQEGALTLLSSIEDDHVLDCDRSQLITAAGFCGWIAADSLAAAKRREEHPDLPEPRAQMLHRAAFPKPLSGTVPQMNTVRGCLEEAVQRLTHSTYDLCVTACARTQQLHAWTLSERTERT